MHKKFLQKLILCTLFAVAFAVFAGAAPTQSAVSSPSPVVLPSAIQAPASQLPVASSPVEPQLNAQVWNLKNADIRAVIQTVSALTGKNFIVDPRVRGNITLVSQKPMTPDEMYQVFLSMLQLLQFTAIPTGNNTVKIVPAMEGNAMSRQVATSENPGIGDEVVVRVVPVNHVSATQLVPVLRPLMSESGSVSAYLPSNSLILAGTASNIKRLVQIIHQMDSSTRSEINVVHLHYANARKVVSIINALQKTSAEQGSPSSVTLAADEDDNTILIKGDDTNQLLMRNLIHKLDQRGSASDNTQVVRLNYLSAKKFAPILQKVAEGVSASQAQAAGKSTQSSGASSSGVSVQAEDASNAVIMHGPKATLDSLMRVIRRLDVRPQEVLVEAIIVKVDESMLNKLGIVWGSSAGVLAGDASGVLPVNSSTAASLSSSSIAEVNSAVLNVNHDFGLLPDGNLLAVLHALKQNEASDILSTPSVVVVNNNKAVITDGQNVGLANRSYQGASATTTGNPAQNEVTPFNTIQRQDVALTLDVTPHISPNNIIQLDLLQRDDTVASLDTSTDQNPVLNVSKIKTSVLVRSGNVLVLGGLMSNQQVKTKQALPILGDLPLIGQLFRYNKHQMEKKTLLVFIRPIIMSGNMAHTQTMNRYSYARHEELQLQTEHIAKIEHLPMLPEIRREPDVTLPQPLPQQTQLPAPTTTGKT